MGSNDTLNTIATAVAGSMTTAAASVVIPTDDQITTFGNLVIQAIIALATVWRLIKRKK